jgi:hypothetical protein
MSRKKEQIYEVEAVEDHRQGKDGQVGSNTHQPLFCVTDFLGLDEAPVPNQVERL